MAATATQIPLLHGKSMLYRVERDYFLEVFESRITLGGIGEVCDGSVTASRPWSANSSPIGYPPAYLDMRDTYNQERAETKAIPSTMADLTRNAIKAAVRMPPQAIPTHICNTSISCYLHIS